MPVVSAQTATQGAPVRIKLEPSCIYVSTVPLTTGAFHWLLVYVDASGTCTSHQWSPISDKDPAGREAYLRTELPRGASSRTAGYVVLGYFKVSDLTPFTLCVEGAFEAICKGVFATSFDNARQNRMNGISCRTWITDIMTKLLSPERALEIERRVTARSKLRSDEWATSFLFSRPFDCVVEDV